MISNTNYENYASPMKWHKCVTYFILPVLILLLAFSTITELVSFFTSNVSTLLPMEEALDIDMMNSILLVFVGIELLTMFLLIIAFVGMLNKKKYGKNVWLICQGLISFGAVYILSIILSIFSSYMPVLTIFSGMGAFDIGKLYILRVGIVLLLLFFVFVFIANVVYYYKRRDMFGTLYTDPIDYRKYEPVYVNEAVSDENVVSSTQEEKKYCPNCGAELSENDINFCSHCGQKLTDEVAVTHNSH